jgi:hypothetical protein
MTPLSLVANLRASVRDVCNGLQILLGFPSDVQRIADSIDSGLQQVAEVGALAATAELIKAQAQLIAAHAELVKAAALLAWIRETSAGVDASPQLEQEVAMSSAGALREVSALVSRLLHGQSAPHDDLDGPTLTRLLPEWGA